MSEGRETGRVEAFSDGVFAIATTLLALEIKVPHSQELGGGSLGAALRHQWPVYLAFVSSFLTILIMWINHHRLFANIRRSDDTFLLLNGFLLMTVTLVPFPTALLAEYIRHREAPLAAAVYAGTYLAMAVIFNLLWRYASHKNRLLTAEHNPQTVAEITRQYRFGPLLYLAALALAFVSVALSIGLNLVLALFFALPPRHAPRVMPK